MDEHIIPKEKVNVIPVLMVRLVGVCILVTPSCYIFFGSIGIVFSLILAAVVCTGMSPTIEYKLNVKHIRKKNKLVDKSKLPVMSNVELSNIGGYKSDYILNSWWVLHDEVLAWLIKNNCRFEVVPPELKTDTYPIGNNRSGIYFLSSADAMKFKLVWG